MKKLFGGLAVAALLSGGAVQATDGPIASCLRDCNGPAMRFLRHPVGFLKGNRTVIGEPVPIGPFNNHWLRPEGGYTLYPGQPGSGYGAHSDYSHVEWMVTPQENAEMVNARLRALGIPSVRPEPIFLGKNPRVTDNLKLPPPRKIEKREPDMGRKPVEDLE